MAQPYIGEIRMFAGNFPPVGWMFCEGQLLPISENETLFNLIGTTYGGDGQSTFALPDLRGRVPVHVGNGFQLAQAAGVEDVTLTVAQLPAHTHGFMASKDPASQSRPPGTVLASNSPTSIYRTLVPPPPQVAMSASMIAPAGGSQPHTNFQPYLCVDFIISLFGIFPSPT